MEGPCLEQSRLGASVMLSFIVWKAMIAVIGKDDWEYSFSRRLVLEFNLSRFINEVLAVLFHDLKLSSDFGEISLDWRGKCWDNPGHLLDQGKGRILRESRKSLSPNGVSEIDRSASSSVMQVGVRSGSESFSQTENGIRLMLAPRSANAKHSSIPGNSQGIRKLAQGSSSSYGFSIWIWEATKGGEQWAKEMELWFGQDLPEGWREELELDRKLGSSCLRAISDNILKSATSDEKLWVEEFCNLPWNKTAFSSCLTKLWTCSR
ncbi:hypothetical protein Tco_0893097 [Tanacetum coccineum]|uniref:Uncharacterized protein n=1 Tax=Tanacetum coccineum TaxID=301880 RepID=A0ABQ5C7U6_9ASTR